MSWSWLPNAISSLRILLAAPVAIALLEGRFALTLGLFAIAALTDACDGWLAKHFGWTSRVGKILDPIADKLLLVTTYVALAALHLVPLWLVAAVVLRDLLIVGGASAYVVLIGYLEGRPTHASKLNTVVQILFALTVVLNAATAGAVPAATLILLGAATFVTTAVSGIDYVATYGRLALANRRAGA